MWVDPQDEDSIDRTLSYLDSNNVEVSNFIQVENIVIILMNNCKTINMDLIH